MKKYLIICVACLAMLCSSCGVSQSATSNTNLTQTSVVLSKRNYRVIGTTEGVSTQNYFFGIGGLSKQSMTQSAMADMYKNANLEATGKSRAVINVNVCYKSAFAFIFGQTKAIATGTVIEFME